jgi:hypothetical protein
LTAPGFTTADLDALSDTVASPGYRLFRARVESELERLRRELERPLEAMKTDQCRGSIHALRIVLEIPQILRDEMKNQIARDEDGI